MDEPRKLKAISAAGESIDDKTMWQKIANETGKAYVGRDQYGREIWRVEPERPSWRQAAADRLDDACAIDTTSATGIDRSPMPWWKNK